MYVRRLKALEYLVIISERDVFYVGLKGHTHSVAMSSSGEISNMLVIGRNHQVAQLPSNGLPVSQLIGHTHRVGSHRSILAPITPKSPSWYDPFKILLFLVLVHDFPY